MAEQKPPSPWWRNSYFTIGFLLAIIAFVGLARGPQAITDPGQPPPTSWLPWTYLGAAVLFIVNGVLSHRVYLSEHARGKGD